MPPYSFPGLKTLIEDGLLAINKFYGVLLPTASVVLILGPSLHSDQAQYSFSNQQYTGCSVRERMSSTS